MLLPGGAGIGKTRTAEELAAIARGRGARVVWGRCYEGEGAPAFWPWSELIRTYTEPLPLAALVAQLGAGAAAIAQVVPAVHARLPELAPPAPLEPEQARFRLFESVAGFLNNAAVGQPTTPLVIILDDLHWADRPSLLLLQFLAQQIADMPLLVICAYRGVGLDRGQPLRRTLGALVREPVCRRIDLPGLSRAEVARFVDQVAGVASDAGLAAAIHTRTEGNPFFVREILRLLAAEGTFDADVRAIAPLAIPETVRDVVLRRLDRLSEACSRALTLAAIVGAEFSVGVLTHLGAGDPTESFDSDNRVLDALEEAEAAEIVANVSGALGRYRFTHTLIREVLYEELPSIRRVRLHARVGAAMEAVYTHDPTPHLAEIAYHFAQAAPGGEAAKAIAYTRRAAGRASDLLAHEEAVRLYRMALQVIELGGASLEEERVELQARLGEALARAGQPVIARDAFREAADGARRLGVPHLLARAALGFRSEVEAGPDEMVIDLLEEALAAVGTSDARLRLDLLISLVRFRRDADRRITLSEEAVDLARRLEDPAALAAALEARRLAIWQPDNLDERLPLSTEAARIATGIGDRATALQARWWRINDLLEQGDIPELDAEIEAYGRLSAESRQRVYQWITLLAKTSRALLDGRLAEAESLAHEALAMGRPLQRRGVRSGYGIQRFVIRLLQGRLRELEPALRAAVDSAPSQVPWRVGLTLAYEETGRVADARHELDQIATDDFATMPRDNMWLSSCCYLAELVASLGDSRRAALLEQMLAPYATRNVVVGVGGGTIGAAAHYLALAAATAGHAAQARGHFETALAINERMGARPWLARTQTAYAALLLAGQRQPDRQRATDLLLLALETADDLGLARTSEQVVGLLDRLGPAPAVDAAAAAPDGLTTRELEVLRLLAAGRTNAEIAGDLVVSVHTVIRHIANIYDKIDVHRRSEATAYALRRGIAPPAGD